MWGILAIPKEGAQYIGGTITRQKTGNDQHWMAIALGNHPPQQWLGLEIGRHFQQGSTLQQQQGTGRAPHIIIEDRHKLFPPAVVVQTLMQGAKLSASPSVWRVLRTIPRLWR